MVAVGRNGNQQMFPIAWAVVDIETKHSWSFFLKYLIEDLNLGTGHGLTVMSDMQKVRWFLYCILFYYFFLVLLILFNVCATTAYIGPCTSFM